MASSFLGVGVVPPNAQEFLTKDTVHSAILENCISMVNTHNHMSEYLKHVAYFTECWFALNPKHATIDGVKCTNITNFMKALHIDVSKRFCKEVYHTSDVWIPVGELHEKYLGIFSMVRFQLSTTEKYSYYLLIV